MAAQIHWQARDKKPIPCSLPDSLYGFLMLSFVAPSLASLRALYQLNLVKVEEVGALDDTNIADQFFINRCLCSGEQTAELFKLIAPFLLALCSQPLSFAACGTARFI